MSSQYIYPTQTFKVSIDLDVKVQFVGMWDGISAEAFNKLYQEIYTSGEFVKLLKEKILEDLEGEPFDCNNPEPFDRLCFEVTESFGDEYD